MSKPQKGRPPIDNPKNVLIKFRADKQLVDDVNYCCDKLHITKSAVLRLGIQKVKSEVDK